MSIDGKMGSSTGISGFRRPRISARPHSSRDAPSSPIWSSIRANASSYSPTCGAQARSPMRSAIIMPFRYVAAALSCATSKAHDATATAAQIRALATPSMSRRIWTIASSLLRRILPIVKLSPQVAVPDRAIGLTKGDSFLEIVKRRYCFVAGKRPTRCPRNLGSAEPQRDPSLPASQRTCDQDQPTHAVPQMPVVRYCSSGSLVLRIGRRSWSTPAPARCVRPKAETRNPSKHRTPPKDTVDRIHTRLDPSMADRSLDRSSTENPRVDETNSKAQGLKRRRLPICMRRGRNRLADRVIGGPRGPSILAVPEQGIAARFSATRPKSGNRPSRNAMGTNAWETQSPIMTLSAAIRSVAKRIQMTTTARTGACTMYIKVFIDSRGSHRIPVAAVAPTRIPA